MVAVAVEDARTEDRTRISNKVNGYGMEMAAIRAGREVTAIIKDAMEAELRSRGFTVGQGGAQAKVAVNRFYASFKQNLFSGNYYLPVTAVMAWVYAWAVKPVERFPVQAFD